MPGLPFKSIDRKVNITGFAEAVKFGSGLIQNGDGGMRLVDFKTWNANSSKQRAVTVRTAANSMKGRT
jgi:hypothetical protein